MRLIIIAIIEICMHLIARFAFELHLSVPLEPFEHFEKQGFAGLTLGCAAPTGCAYSVSPKLSCAHISLIMYASMWNLVL